MCQQAVQHLLLSKRTVQNLTILYCALVVSRVLNLAVSGLLYRIAGGQWNLSQGSEEENPPSPHRGTISVSEICSFFVKLLLLFGLVFSGLLLSCFDIHAFVLWPGTWRFVCHYRPGGCFFIACLCRFSRIAHSCLSSSPDCDPCLCRVLQGLSSGCFIVLAFQPRFRFIF